MERDGRRRRSAACGARYKARRMNGMGEVGARVRVDVLKPSNYSAKPPFPPNFETARDARGVPGTRARRSRCPDGACGSDYDDRRARVLLQRRGSAARTRSRSRPAARSARPTRSDARPPDNVRRSIGQSDSTPPMPTWKPKISRKMTSVSVVLLAPDHVRREVLGQHRVAQNAGAAEDAVRGEQQRRRQRRAEHHQHLRRARTAPCRCRRTHTPRRRAAPGCAPPRRNRCSRPSSRSREPTRAPPRARG